MLVFMMYSIMVFLHILQFLLIYLSLSVNINMVIWNNGPIKVLIIITIIIVVRDNVNSKASLLPTSLYLKCPLLASKTTIVNN